MGWGLQAGQLFAYTVFVLGHEDVRVPAGGLLFG